MQIFHRRRIRPPYLGMDHCASGLIALWSLVRRDDPSHGRDPFELGKASLDCGRRTTCRRMHAKAEGMISGREHKS